jgi:hypothetical protein
MFLLVGVSDKNKSMWKNSSKNTTLWHKEGTVLLTAAAMVVVCG